MDPIVHTRLPSFVERVGFREQVVKTPSYPVVCPLPLFAELCDHNSPTLQIDGADIMPLAYKRDMHNNYWMVALKINKISQNVYTPTFIMDPFSCSSSMHCTVANRGVDHYGIGGHVPQYLWRGVASMIMSPNILEVMSFMSTRVTATVVCCILTQILCVVSQKASASGGLRPPDPLPGLRPWKPLRSLGPSFTSPQQSCEIDALGS